MSAIEVKNLVKKFHGQTVLHGIDLEVKPGEVVAIIGPSGSGKTTLLRSINLLEQPEAGTITVGDITIDTARSLSQQKQTMRRAILPQAARVALPPLSNSFISLVKDTSLAATIQVPELFRQAQLITSRTLEVFTMYLAASLIYWIMATVLSTLQNHFENQLNRQEREPK